MTTPRSTSPAPRAASALLAAETLLARRAEERRASVRRLLRLLLLRGAAPRAPVRRRRRPRRARRTRRYSRRPPSSAFRAPRRPRRRRTDQRPDRVLRERLGRFVRTVKTPPSLEPRRPSRRSSSRRRREQQRARDETYDEDARGASDELEHDAQVFHEQTGDGGEKDEDEGLRGESLAGAIPRRAAGTHPNHAHKTSSSSGAARVVVDRVASDRAHAHARRRREHWGSVAGYDWSMFDATSPSSRTRTPRPSRTRRGASAWTGAPCAPLSLAGAPRRPRKLQLRAFAHGETLDVLLLGGEIEGIRGDDETFRRRPGGARRPRRRAFVSIAAA